MKFIHFHIYDPTKAIFKGSRNGKATAMTIECDSYQRCGLYKRGECTFLSMLSSGRCPYGRMRRTEGYTRRARKFREWIQNKREQYKDVGKLKPCSSVMAIVGDYIFLPYAHITNNEKVPFLAHGGAFRSGNCFVPMEHFTVENIIKMVTFRPQALMGGEITTYQTKSVPKFLLHLSEQQPDIFSQVIEQSEHAKRIYQSFTNVGRKAILDTLTPNIGKFVDTHGDGWTWDGEWLASTNSHSPFMLVKKFSEIKIKPDKGQVVKITDEKQVNSETRFVD